MFVYSVRAGTVKLFGILGLAAAALIALIFLLPTTVKTAPTAAPEAKVNYEKVKTNDNRRDFLAQFGWEVEENPTEEVEIRIPADFDKVMSSYNEIQRAQGLDLSRHKGKNVTRYTYKITNYPDYDGTVYANVIVYKNRVVGGDICSSDVSGFIHGFEKPE